MSGRLVLVDGDIVVYRCAFAAEHTVYTLLDPEGQQVIGMFDSAADYKAYVTEKEFDVADFRVETEKHIEPLSHALANVKSVMSRILEQGTQGIVFLSQGKCYRDRIATLKVYKGNRKDAARPWHYDDVRKFLMENYDTRMLSELEADDALAMMQSEDTIIASIDKDLLQVPGLHYNWVKDEGCAVSPQVGRKKKYIQVLTGDTTDNIPGIFRLGEKGARKLLDGLEFEEQMYIACLTAWEVYLKSGQADTRLGGAWDDQYGAFMYTDVRNGSVTGGTPNRIVDEILSLITVGGFDAKEVSISSGEEVLLTRSTSGPRQVTQGELESTATL